MSSRAATGSPETREAILDACKRVLASRAGPFSMAAVAAAAGVSRQGVYLHFPGRTELLEALVERLKTEGPIGEKLRAIVDSSDGRTALTAFADVALWQSREHGAVLAAVRDAVAADPELAAAWSKRRSGRNSAAAGVAQRLHDESRLRRGMDAATARRLLLALTSPELVRDLLATVPFAEARATLLRCLDAALLE